MFSIGVPFLRGGRSWPLSTPLLALGDVAWTNKRFAGIKCGGERRPEHVQMHIDSLRTRDSSMIFLLCSGSQSCFFPLVCSILENFKQKHLF